MGWLRRRRRCNNNYQPAQQQQQGAQATRRTSGSPGSQSAASPHNKGMQVPMAPAVDQLPKPSQDGDGFQSRGQRGMDGGPLASSDGAQRGLDSDRTSDVSDGDGALASESGTTEIADSVPETGGDASDGGGTEGSEDSSGTEGSEDSSGTEGSEDSGGTEGSEDSGGTEGSEDSSGTEGSEDSSGTEGSEDSGGTEGSEDSSGTEGSEDSSGTEGSEDSGGTEGSEDSGGTEGSEDSGGTEGSEDSSGTEGSEDSSGTEGSEDSGGTEGAEDSIGETTLEESMGSESGMDGEVSNSEEASQQEVEGESPTMEPTGGEESASPEEGDRDNESSVLGGVGRAFGSVFGFGGGSDTEADATEASQGTGSEADATEASQGTGSEADATEASQGTGSEADATEASQGTESEADTTESSQGSEESETSGLGNLFNNITDSFGGAMGSLQDGAAALTDKVAKAEKTLAAVAEMPKKAFDTAIDAQQSHLLGGADERVTQDDAHKIGWGLANGDPGIHSQINSQIWGRANNHRFPRLARRHVSKNYHHYFNNVGKPQAASIAAAQIRGQMAQSGVGDLPGVGDSTVNRSPMTRGFVENWANSMQDIQAWGEKMEDARGQRFTFPGGTPNRDQLIQMRNLETPTGEGVREYRRDDETGDWNRVRDGQVTDMTQQTDEAFDYVSGAKSGQSYYRNQYDDSMKQISQHLEKQGVKYSKTPQNMTASQLQDIQEGRTPQGLNEYRQDDQGTYRRMADGQMTDMDYKTGQAFSYIDHANSGNYYDRGRYDQSMKTANNYLEQQGVKYSHGLGGMNSEQLQAVQDGRTPEGMSEYRQDDQGTYRRMADGQMTDMDYKTGQAFAYVSHANSGKRYYRDRYDQSVKTANNYLDEKGVRYSRSLDDMTPQQLQAVQDGRTPEGMSEYRQDDQGQYRKMQDGQMTDMTQETDQAFSYANRAKSGQGYNQAQYNESMQQIGQYLDQQGVSYDKQPQDMTASQLKDIQEGRQPSGLRQYQKGEDGKSYLMRDGQRTEMDKNTDLSFGYAAHVQNGGRHSKEDYDRSLDYINQHLDNSGVSYNRSPENMTSEQLNALRNGQEPPGLTRYERGEDGTFSRPDTGMGKQLDMSFDYVQGSRGSNGHRYNQDVVKESQQRIQQHLDSQGVQYDKSVSEMTASQLQAIQEGRQPEGLKRTT